MMSLPPPIILADIMTAFRTSNLLSGKLIVAILFVASIFAWTVMVSKYRELKLALLSSRRFLHAFRHEGNPLALFLRGREFPRSPLYSVYAAGCKALGGELGVESDVRATPSLLSSETATSTRLSSSQVEVIRRVTERTVADEALELESRMGFLMTAVSASPLLGLLGTVWGVLDAFGSMAEHGSAHLSAVAPGISGALLTTVVGLLVAIPSSIGYNLLAGRIRTIAVQMDNFSQEFVAALQRAFTHE